MSTTAIKERPILFSDAMVKAILAGTKTVTRRVIKPQPNPECWQKIVPGWYEPTIVVRGEQQPGPQVYGFANEEEGWQCPYGAPGDALWVRECWAPIPQARPSGYFSNLELIGKDYWYRASDCLPTWGGKWKPSIHMPRVAARLLLEVKSVRAERVQEISEEDAIAEGLKWSEGDGFSWGFRVSDGCVEADPIQAFAELWDSINGTRAGCAWADNPWVWVVEFERVNDE